MKTYQQAAAVCVLMGLLGGVASYGVEENRRPANMDTRAFSASAPEYAVQMAGQTAPDPSRAAELFRQGQRYFYGAGVIRNDENAAYYYSRSAELGNARAQLSLGMMYATGRGVQKDFDEAIARIYQASSLAQLPWHDEAVAQAVSWLQEASSHGYAPARHAVELMQNGAGCPGVDKSVFCFWRQSVSAKGRGRQFPAPQTNGAG